MKPEAVDALIKPCTLKDLRVQCRARGLSPAGSREALADRLKENMMDTNDYSMKNESGDVITPSAAASLDFVAGGRADQNNYIREAGQNVGNFLTEKPTSRVLAPPGGESQMSLAHGENEPAAKADEKTGLAGLGGGAKSNNYSRPGGQNVGNFLTERNSSRVLAPPGGKSNVLLG